MDKIDKEIISIIWDYMDKTLCEWCLFIDDLWVYYTYDNKLPKWLIRKIIGHYDITAVLKYIELNKWRFTSDFSWLFIIDILKNDWDNIWEIPNKPLHLYTQEEKQNLLDLLLKLK